MLPAVNKIYLLPFANLLPTLQPGQVVWLRTLALWVQLQMRGVLGCSTVLNSQVVLCATVISPLGQLLSICATLPIIWRDPGSENVRAVKTVGTGVALSPSVLLVSYVLFLAGSSLIIRFILSPQPLISPGHLRKRLFYRYY